MRVQGVEGRNADKQGISQKWRLFRYPGAALVALIQVAPITAIPDSSGRVVLSFGYGIGEFEASRFVADPMGCSGTTTRQILEAATAGLAIDVWGKKESRVSAYAGHVNTDTPDPGMTAMSGMYMGLMMAEEKSSVGYGLGLSMWREKTSNPDNSLSSSSTRLAPQVYFRLGDANRVHLRVNTGGTMASGLPPTITTVGVGYGMGRQHKLGVFVGLTAPSLSDEIHSGMLLAGSVPIAAGFDVTAGLYRSNDDPVDNFLAFGARLNFRR